MVLSYNKKKDRETRKLMKTVHDICEQAKKKESQADQMIYVINRISGSCTYNPRTYNNGSAYGCLVLGHARCTGYAQSMQLCMKELGIPVRYKTALNLTHIWNQVKVDGQWIDLDLTGISSRNKRLKLINIPYKGII